MFFEGKRDGQTEPREKHSQAFFLSMFACSLPFDHAALRRWIAQVDFLKLVLSATGNSFRGKSNETRLFLGTSLVVLFDPECGEICSMRDPQHGFHEQAFCPVLLRTENIHTKAWTYYIL